MSRTVIQVEGLGKRYRIGLAKRHNALSHVIGDVLRTPMRLLRPSHNSDAHANVGSAGPSATSRTSTHTNPKYNGSPYIWALKDVSFEVKEGEVGAAGVFSTEACRGTRALGLTAERLLSDTPAVQDQ